MPTTMELDHCHSVRCHRHRYSALQAQWNTKHTFPALIQHCFQIIDVILLFVSFQVNSDWGLGCGKSIWQRSF